MKKTHHSSIAITHVANKMIKIIWHMLTSRALYENRNEKLYQKKLKCDCPDHRFRNTQCKHILAVTLLAEAGTEAPNGCAGGTVAKAPEDAAAETWKAPVPEGRKEGDTGCVPCWGGTVLHIVRLREYKTERVAVQQIRPDPEAQLQGEEMRQEVRLSARV